MVFAAIFSTLNTDSTDPTMPGDNPYPPGGTYFDRVKSFADVPVKDSGIATTEFLEAAESLTTLFGMLWKRRQSRRG